MKKVAYTIVFCLVAVALLATSATAKGGSRFNTGIGGNWGNPASVDIGVYSGRKQNNLTLTNTCQVVEVINGVPTVTFTHTDTRQLTHWLAYNINGTTVYEDDEFFDLSGDPAGATCVALAGGAELDYTLT